MPKTLFDKIWDAHEVAESLLYVDVHLVHEVTSPQAFESLRLAGRPVRRPDRTLATADHNVPTDGASAAAQIRDRLSRVQVETLERNCRDFGVPLYSIGSQRQGIVHIIGPELGLTQPGMTIACGDSHTSTHGAFGALAFGIGTSEVEHVLATQTLQQRKPRSMRIRYEGELGYGVTAKDLILGTIGRIGVDGGVGHVIEYAGPPIERLSMEGRMTVCNMTIEGGGRAGMIAPDDTTFEWVEGRPAAPEPLPLDEWRGLRTDGGAEFHREVVIDAAELSPQVTWGTTPGMVVDVTGAVPEPRGDGRSSTWRSRPARRCRRSSWIGCSSAPARTPVSETSERQPRW
jgi:3-isopropylmalate/(R)-2-methylmalate dehydratase large subunit